MIVSLSNTISRKYNKKTQGELPLFFVHPESLITNFTKALKKKTKNKKFKLKQSIKLNGVNERAFYTLGAITLEFRKLKKRKNERDNPYLVCN